MYEQIDFRFRCQVGITSLHATLLQYLQSKQTEFPRERMILWSLSAFWHPSACKWLGKSTEAELKQKAKNAIYELQQQINYLAQNFGLEPQDFANPTTGYSASSFNQMSIIDKPTTSTAPNGGIKTTSVAALDVAPDLENTLYSSPPVPAAELLMSNADDSVLDEAFEN